MPGTGLRTDGPGVAVRYRETEEAIVPGFWRDRYSEAEIKKAYKLAWVLGGAIILLLYGLGGLALYLRAQFLSPAPWEAPLTAPPTRPMVSSVLPTDTPTPLGPTLLPSPTLTLYPTLTPRP